MAKKGLTELECKNAQPGSKRYRLADTGGLYMEIWPNGSRYWRFKYRYLGKEKLLALGVYPLITLREAREARDIAKKKVFSGVDPSAAKKREKQLAILNSENTFEAVAREWHSQQKERWSEVHSRNVLNLLELNIFPHLGSRPIADLTAPELLSVLRKVEKRGAAYLSNRIKQICGQVLRYGIATGRGLRDHAADIKGALKATKVEHFAALDIREMPEFLAALDKNSARLYERTRRAIRLLMLTFVRTTELIEAKWEEFDLENAVWEIPAERMKMSKPHIVPLSRQAIALLKEQQAETAIFKNCPWVFPSQIKPLNPMSNNTVLFAIGRLGYKGRMTGHGFRALAMTTIKEKLGYRHEVVDRQLAHAPASKVDRAYDRAKFLDDRKKMMEEWADYLDAIVSKNQVIQENLKRRA
ncbi:MAG: tyrosine-type recombinase/integrase [Alphaproteobacteria bacterium]